MSTAIIGARNSMALFWSYALTGCPKGGQRLRGPGGGGSAAAWSKAESTGGMPPPAVAWDISGLLAHVVPGVGRLLQRGCRRALAEDGGLPRGAVHFVPLAEPARDH